MLTDEAYTSKANRAHLRARGIRACIPGKADCDASAPEAALARTALVGRRRAGGWTGCTAVADERAPHSVPDREPPTARC